jgi:hypothetical protein
MIDGYEADVTYTRSLPYSGVLEFLTTGLGKVTTVNTAIGLLNSCVQNISQNYWITNVSLSSVSNLLGTTTTSLTSVSNLL